MAALILHGFKNEKEIQDFLDWYGNAGEQYYYQDTDKDVQVDYNKPVEKSEGIVTAHVK